MPGLAAPHDRIAACSRAGSPLLLRLRSNRPTRRGHLWLRVHVDGSRERVDGDERSESVVTALAGPDPPRAAAAADVCDRLLRCLHPRDLSGPPPWPKYYPVQAFAGTTRAVEGHIGVEVDMGTRSDIFGLDGDAASNARLLDDIVELLALLRR